MEIKNMNTTDRWPFKDETPNPTCAQCNSVVINDDISCCQCGYFHHGYSSKTHKWDMRFLDLARIVSQWSKDPSTQTGAVIVRPDRTVASVGFNGFPRGMADLKVYYDNREVKYRRVVHCEMNAILSCRDQDLSGCTIYIWPFGPCERCSTSIIQTGISRAVFPNTKQGAATTQNIQNGVGYLVECGIQTHIYNFHG